MMGPEKFATWGRGKGLTASVRNIFAKNIMMAPKAGGKVKQTATRCPGLFYIHSRQMESCD